MTGAERGRFITFEGGEGVGKSTQLRRLAEHLRACGIEAVTTREPGGTPKAERLRRILLSGRIAPLGALAEATLFAAARIDHVENLIAPSLARGAWVLCDRFTDSTRAYQGARGGVEPQALALLEKAAVGDLEPDLTIVIDLPPKDGLARAAVRREVAGERADRFEAEDGGFHEGLRRAFLDIAEREPERCCVVNGALPPDEVARAIRQLVDARFLDAQPAATAAQ
ncbi:dTMP kinase [Methylocystis parvus]|uniref:Thymidylate kinase n=1 Tax=Methylocystis parvus TaxID=134 RepID=A0A6B8M8J0_9HYPH|nr:dTMP kinase [Methylocystis parvus]QGM98878.1 dTMP kinase [Methylocystis parvus]WBK00767.1 dTMP kinase [Methylocystis parvus OBBP]